MSFFYESSRREGDARENLTPGEDGRAPTEGGLCSCRSCSDLVRFTEPEESADLREEFVSTRRLPAG